MNNLQDFQYDYTNFISKENYSFHDNESIDKLIKSYLFTHQFSEDILITREELLSIIEYFLEENEYVFENKDKILIILNDINNIDNVISFLEWLFKIMSINIIEIKIINKNNLMITIKNYENTFNGTRIEEYHF